MAVIRFTAPKPYQDIGFRIIDKPWDRKRTRIVYDRGILQYVLCVSTSCGARHLTRCRLPRRPPAVQVVFPVRSEILQKVRRSPPGPHETIAQCTASGRVLRVETSHVVGENEFLVFLPSEQPGPLACRGRTVQQRSNMGERLDCSACTLGRRRSFRLLKRVGGRNSNPQPD